MMEKMIWLRSNSKTLGVKEDDGLEAVNKYWEDGWKVKLISACAVGDSIVSGQAYVVIEKD